jgi:sugar lactone lactonase YvrE
LLLHTRLPILFQTLQPRIREEKDNLVLPLRKTLTAAILACAVTCLPAQLPAPSGILTTVAGNGYAGISGDGGPATSAQFAAPQAVAVDSHGNLYIADTDESVVRKVDATTGIISRYAGSGSGGYSGDNGPATSAELNIPSGLALDSANNLYIADSRNNVIRKVDAKSGIITTVVGNGVDAGSPILFDGYCPMPRIDNVPATQSPLCSPSSVAVDLADNIYFTDFDHGVVRKVTAKTGIVTSIAGTGVDGFPSQSGSYGYTGDGGPAIDAQISYPSSLVLDAQRNVYFVDLLNCAVRKVAASTGIITSILGTPNPSGFYGVCGLAGDGGLASAAEIGSYTPSIAIDQYDNLYLADYTNDSIRVIYANNHKIDTLAGVYQPPSIPLQGQFFDGGPSYLALLSGPNGLATDPQGNLYIADTGNRIVRKVTSAGASPAETPLISPISGSISSPTTVTITAPTAGSTIYYTTDGSIPTIHSTHYTGPFSVDATSFITAFATVPKQLNSQAAVAGYLYAPAPSISPQYSTNSTPAVATIKDGNPNAQIYYTLNGLTPTYGPLNSILYSGPISITDSTDLQAAAYVLATTPYGYSIGAYGPVASVRYVNSKAKAPTATNTAATGITSSGAFLNGKIVANNSITTYYFYFGTSKTNLTSVTAGTGAFVSGTNSTSVSSSTEGYTLLPKTTYYFQLIAQNTVGVTAASNILSFTTK